MTVTLYNEDSTTIDQKVCNMARVSFAKTHDQYTDEQNERLIKYLATHNHFTPATHSILHIEGTLDDQELVNLSYNRIDILYPLSITRITNEYNKYIISGSYYALCHFAQYLQLSNVQYILQKTAPIASKYYTYNFDGYEDDFIQIEAPNIPKHQFVTLHFKMPIFVSNQWFKHQLGFTRNSVSRRYVDDTPEFYQPKEWRKRAENKKQGSSDEVVGLYYQREIDQIIEGAIDTYNGMTNYDNIAPEMARMILPQSMYTEFYETADLVSYARLCNLRLKPDTQKETREYAEQVDVILADKFGDLWEEVKND